MPPAGSVRVHLGHMAGYQALGPSGHRRRLTTAQAIAVGPGCRAGAAESQRTCSGQLLWVQVLASLSSCSMRVGGGAAHVSATWGGRDTKHVTVLAHVSSVAVGC